MNRSAQVDGADWDKGLPSDVLAMVARAGGITEMKAMRGVSKQWQEGFELAVVSIKASLKTPSLPREVALRFPVLTSLDVGETL